MNEKTSTLYEFDEFRLDAARKCLWHSDELVSLTPKALETLLVLVRHGGEVVGKDVLLDEVWAETFVEESTLSQNILTLRKTLGAYGKDKQFIVTVPRRGYRFVADVREIEGGDQAWIVEKRTRTRIVAERCEIDDSAGAEKSEAAAIQTPRARRTTGRRAFIGALLGLSLAAAGFFAARWLSNPGGFAETKFQKFSLNQLYSSAGLQRAVVSPDGKYLALIERRDEKDILMIRSIAGADSLAIVPGFEGRLIDASFAPESDYVFYAGYPKDSREGELYKIPILGGAGQTIVKNIDSGVSISADGRKIAFIRRDPEQKETILMLADADGRGERRLAAREFGEGFLGAAFSPDGKSLACPVNSRANPEKPAELVIVDARTGEQRALTSHGWTWIGQTVWLKDGSGVALVGYGPKSPNLTDEVWFVSYPDGRARLLQNGVNGIFGLSLTDDGNSLVTVRTDKITSFLVSPLDDLSRQTALLTKTGDESLLPLGADWTNDGRLVYAATQNGGADIWTIDADGGGPKQLTFDPGADVSPKVSADGKFIYFLSNRADRTSVWRMNADGTDARRITADAEVFGLDIAPGGEAIFYTARTGDIFTQTLWRVAADGRGARPLTAQTTASPRVSPDGRTIACYYPGEQRQQFRLTLLSAEDGRLLRQFETPAGENPGLLEWDPDGRSLLTTSRQNGATILRRQPADGGPATILKEWPNETVFRLALARDGRQLFYEKGVTANSVLLLRDISSGEEK